MTRITEINGHAVDMKRILMIGPVENGAFKVTIALGWELPVKGDQAARDELVRQWGMWLWHDDKVRETNPVVLKP
jgi:hypothetical protein